MDPSIRAAAALSTARETPLAVGEATEGVADQLEGTAPDLAVVFFSPHHTSSADEIGSSVHGRLRPRHLIGCTGEWIVGGVREVEDAPAISLWAAKLGGAKVEAFHSRFVRTSEGQGFTGFPEVPPDARAILLLADPFSYPADVLLRAAGDRLGLVPFVGGMASGGMHPGTNRLLCDERVHDEGAVGVVLSGDVAVSTIVSQGCKPIGESFVVTRSDGNVLYELAGRPALERLEQAVAKLDPRELQVASGGLHVGIVIDEQKDVFGRGDFLIRGVVGAEPTDGAIIVGDHVDVGRTVQFHLRDAASADEDLRELCTAVARRPAGGLLFTCNGRGSRMFAVPDHDAGAIAQTVGDIPLAGLFCQGEIGPVGGRSFLHGFTASAAFFG